MNKTIGRKLIDCMTKLTFYTQFHNILFGEQRGRSPLVFRVEQHFRETSDMTPKITWFAVFVNVQRIF